MIYHRWAAISMVGAMLGRNVSMPFGHSFIYPNQYIMLVGSPGARKGAAMKPTTNALRSIEYSKLASDRVSPEYFIKELRDLNNGIELNGTELENLTFHDSPSEIYVIAEEFADFVRAGAIDFINLLTNLWDNKPEYKHPKLHGESIIVSQPTVSIFGATNPQNMAIALPIEAIGQGFLSRWILVHAEPTGRQITFPKQPTQEQKDTTEEMLRKIQKEVIGNSITTDEAKVLLDTIYKKYKSLDDQRFEHYNTRRFTHLLKLCIVFAAMDLSLIITARHVLMANTLLHVTEQRMPRALGEFGKSRHSDVANAIVDMLKKSRSPMTVREIWKQVIQNLNKIDELVEIIRNLETAEKIQKKTINGKTGYLPSFKTENQWSNDLLLEDFLYPEEKL